MHAAYFRVSFTWGAVLNYKHLNSLPASLQIELGKCYKWKDIDKEEWLSTNITTKKYPRMQTLLKNLNV